MEDIKKFTEKIKEILNLLDLSNDVLHDVKKRDNYIKELIDAVIEIYENIDNKQIYNSIDDVTKKIKDLIAKKYTIKNNVFIGTNHEKWDVIYKIYYAFDNVNKEIENITKHNTQYKIIDEKIIERIEEVGKLQETFHKDCSIFLLTIERGVYEIMKIIEPNYDVNDMKILKDDTGELMKHSYVEISEGSKLNVLNIGHNNAIKEILKSINKDNIYNTDKYFTRFTENIDVMKTFIPQTTYSEIKNLFGGNKISKELYKFNIRMQEIQKTMEKIYDTLKKYTQLLMRVENYYLFTAMCIKRTLFGTERKQVLQYLDKHDVKKYLDMMRDILTKTHTYNQYDENTKDTLYKFNKYHYITIKKLDYFLSFALEQLKENEIISVNDCRGEVLTSLMILDKFISILEKEQR